MKLRVLFVDDEPRLLRGLRRMLSDMEDHWELEFAESGEEALRILDAKKIDVVVSDLRMPGMDGAELLNEVMDRYPDVVRIVLSGFADRDITFKSIGLTHQYLVKPCEEEVLKSAINRAFALRDLLKSDDIKKLVSRIKTLPSLPDTYLQVLAELRSPEASIKKIGEIISKDVGMTAKILQLVNSAFFGLGRHVSSATDAASLLGLETIKALVLTIHVFSQFDENSLPGFNIRALWRHSVSVGGTAHYITRSRSAEPTQVNDALTAGLLHDVGKLILALNLPDQYRDALSLARTRNIALFKAEKEIFGACHAETGAYLLGLWGLPDPIVEALAFHHSPSRCLGRSFSALTAVHVADVLEHRENPQPDGFASEQLDSDYLEGLGLEGRLPEWSKACCVERPEGVN